MKHQVIALLKQPGEIKFMQDTAVPKDTKLKIRLPEGCTGILYCFESKKTAKKYFGKDVELIRVEDIKNGPKQ